MFYVFGRPDREGFVFGKRSLTHCKYLAKRLCRTMIVTPFSGLSKRHVNCIYSGWNSAIHGASRALREQVIGATSFASFC
jgi:short-subunit dehydrogenase involved in D-alanine esterification of teichoic acids